MKKWGIVVFMFIIGELQAQEQLIIRVPKQTEWNILKINKQLQCLEGVHFSGYVQDASCLLLRYDPVYIQDISIITTMIRHLNKKLKVEVIKGITAYDVIDGKLNH